VRHPKVSCVEQLKSTKIFNPNHSEFKSAAAGSRQANADMDKLRRKCANTIHAVVRLLSDPDVMCGLHLVVLGTTPMYDEFKLAVAELNDPDSTMRFFVDRYNFGCLKNLARTYGTLHDTMELDKCGITIKASKDCSPTQRDL
jgi:hypothetical protein